MSGVFGSVLAFLSGTFSMSLVATSYRCKVDGARAIAAKRIPAGALAVLCDHVAAARGSFGTLTSGSMDIDYFRGLSYSEKVWHIASNPNAAAFAYDRLKLHRASAVVQMSRICEAAERARVASTEPPQSAGPAELRAHVQSARDHMVPLLFEIHFYFVAWTNCGHMMTVLTGDSAFLEAKKVFDSHKKTFDHYAHGRNSFEHFHDRLPGRPEERRVKEIRDDPATGSRRVYTGFEEGKYKHSDKSWDITPASLELLNRIINEVLAVVHRTIDEQIRIKFMSAQQALHTSAEPPSEK